MAWKPITEYAPGANCVDCWGPGKTFGDITTPLRVTMTGSGFGGGCAVCNGTFILTQNGGNPCLWEFDDGTARGFWQLSAPSSIFSMGISGGLNCYLATEGPCVLTSTIFGFTVTIAIAEPQTPEYKIAIEQNFSPSLSTYYRDRGPVDTDEVLQIAKRLDRIRLLTKYTPEY